MYALETYRKFVTLSNRKEVFIRLLNGQDRSTLIKFFQQAPQEDIQFCRQDVCLLYTSPSPRDGLLSRMPSSA